MARAFIRSSSASSTMIAAAASLLELRLGLLGPVEDLDRQGREAATAARSGRRSRRPARPAAAAAPPRPARGRAPGSCRWRCRGRRPAASAARPSASGVAPSAREPCRISCGTARSASRVVMMMTGRISSASAIAPASTTRRCRPMRKREPGGEHAVDDGRHGGEVLRLTSMSRLYQRRGRRTPRGRRRRRHRAGWPAARSVAITQIEPRMAARAPAVSGEPRACTA